ncbi:sensor histidine kinase [Olleya sp. Bg11-27]|uniref:sensor histidine kinase n=1 Tax=Olleya sp. Bg11-27 TaxID=2058135 RepID=UPI000C309C78|nr:ATP-binding protein [Olleya sp. Bg11-27]AUC75761.1 histidine kinase [Olleya sp. Bg11-27]
MQREGQAILIAVFILVFLCIMLIVLFIVFQKRKNTLILKQKDSEKRFGQEIAKTQIEIREETFRNISWELHDNIGQLLTLAKIQLQNSTNKEDILLTLDKGLKELRALSKSISPETLKNSSLVSAIIQETDRLNKLEYLKAKVNVIGNEVHLDNEVEIVFFRIIQEFLSNTIKHAKATTLEITIQYLNNTVQITAKDNGQGFNNSNNEQIPNGMGIKNIIKRAQLINAEATITSKINEGTQLQIFYKELLG